MTVATQTTLRAHLAAQIQSDSSLDRDLAAVLAELAIQTRIIKGT